MAAGLQKRKGSRGGAVHPDLRHLEKKKEIVGGGGGEDAAKLCKEALSDARGVKAHGRTPTFRAGRV